MADEITLTASLAYADSESADVLLEKCNVSATAATKKFTHVKHNVGTTEEAMILGEVTALGYCCIVNRDATNFIEVRAASGGTKIVKVPAGKAAVFHFGSGVTAPYLIADTAACQVEYLLVNT